MKINHWSTLLGASLLVLGLAPQLGRAFEDQTVVATGPATIWVNGSFPVENFQGYTSPFGYRVSPTGGYTTEFHSGLDFAAPDGSYIRSWWSGRVIEVSDHTACGTTVRVQSGSWIHIYCHLRGRVARDAQGSYIDDRGSGLQIRQGQTIDSGQRIGRVGMTGRTTGPHLHWTLRYEGKLVDPAVVLRAMYAAQRQGTTLSQQSF
ncbi:peptidoglycan DD-metalloendopeptidase family protein [Synechococcales cyanobacterium C]|uniref:Peptidoglycan DD-metalloendopeptidase family protein n=1 Tax=Petrachloros mirabilis ULC683 TaxID=2781853 RepID=A0A8K1ZVU9_9CYAN|nr:M23 family metallopeptidase [Petrachloros mirabilis]NCJ06165.1 peptidoglycan DD-metalloendopeptidase family protein [Petrachloros mirabilis ULC683]